MTTTKDFVEGLRENPGFLLIETEDGIIEVRGEEGEMIRETDEKEVMELLSRTVPF